MRKIIPTAANIARLIESPQAQKLLTELERDAERELDARRAAAVEKIKGARARSERERPALQERAAKCVEAVKSAEKALAAAQRDYTGAAAAALDASNLESRAVTEAETVLIDTAPDSVKVFQRWLFDEFDRVRHSVTTYPAPSTGNPALGAIKRKFVQTNAPSTKQYVAAIHAARKEVQALVLTEPSRAAIDARIVELQSELPNNIDTEVVEV